MKKRIFTLVLAVMLMAAVFTGCAKNEAPIDESSSPGTTDVVAGDLKDGTYLVKTEVSDNGNFSMAKLEVKDGQVTDFHYDEYLVASGEAKSSDNYPYEDGIAVIADLNAQFNEKKDLNAVDYDAVSGATHTKGTFKELSTELLDKAAKGETYAPVYTDGVYEAKADEDSHGWLSQVSVKVQDGQIVGVNYEEVAIEDGDGYKIGDVKSPENYSFEVPFEVAKSVQKLVIDNNGTENLSLDGITGATSTRDTMIELINEALSSAK